MAVEGEVLARDFLKLEARKHQLEALQWQSVEGIRCRQSVEDVRRAANVGQTDRKIEQGEQERLRTLERNQLIREQASLYERQIGANLPADGERGGGRSEAMEKLRDSRKAFAGQVEQMTGQWHQAIENQMKEEIRQTRADATSCQMRQHELLQASCRQEQLLQELLAERNRMQDERTKLKVLDMELAERNRKLREHLEREREAADSCGAREAAEITASAARSAGVDSTTPVAAEQTQDAKAPCMRTEPPCATPSRAAEAAPQPSSTEKTLRPQVASMAAAGEGSAKPFVPRQGTRQFEVYQRLMHYEHEMQSDLRLLEACPLPVLLQDRPVSRKRSNIGKIDFDPGPGAPVVFVPAAPPRQTHGINGALQRGNGDNNTSRDPAANALIRQGAICESERSFGDLRGSHESMQQPYDRRVIMQGHAYEGGTQPCLEPIVQGAAEPSQVILAAASTPFARFHQSSQSAGAHIDPLTLPATAPAPTSGIHPAPPTVPATAPAPTSRTEPLAGLLEWAKAPARTFECPLPWNDTQADNGQLHPSLLGLEAVGGDSFSGASAGHAAASTVVAQPGLSSSVSSPAHATFPTQASLQMRGLAAFEEKAGLGTDAVGGSTAAGLGLPSGPPLAQPGVRPEGLSAARIPPALDDVLGEPFARDSEKTGIDITAAMFPSSARGKSPSNHGTSPTPMSGAPASQGTSPSHNVGFAPVAGSVMQDDAAPHRPYFPFAQSTTSAKAEVKPPGKGIDERPLHMQVPPVTPFSPSHSMDMGQSGEFHISSSGEPNMDAWIPLSSRAEQAVTTGGQHANISLQESVSFSLGELHLGPLSPQGVAGTAPGTLPSWGMQDRFPREPQTLDAMGTCERQSVSQAAEQIPAEIKPPARPSETMSLTQSATDTVNASLDSGLGASAPAKFEDAASLARGAKDNDANCTYEGRHASGGMARPPSDPRADVSASSAQQAQPWQDTRPLGWGKASSHSGAGSGAGTPTSLHSGRDGPASGRAGSELPFETRGFGRPTAEPMQEDRQPSELPFENRSFGRPDDSPVNSNKPAELPFESRSFGRPVDTLANSGQTPEFFESRAFGRPADSPAVGNTTAELPFEPRSFGKPANSPAEVEKPADVPFETREFGRPADAKPAPETRSFGRPSETPTHSSRQRDEAIAAIAAGAKPAPKAPAASAKSRSPAPWDAAMATLGLAEDNDEVQGSESEGEPFYTPGNRGGRVGSSPARRQTPKEASRPADATPPAKAKAGIQPAFNSFDIGANADELSESEDILKASQDQPSEEGSGSLRTPTQRRNPLDRGRGGRGRGGTKAGLLGGGGGRADDDFEEFATIGGRGRGKAKASAGSGRGAFGGSAGLDYISPSKASSLSAFKPKAKSASKFNLSSALGGDIDWSQANDPRW